jgi:hypothetical protein
MSDTTDTSYIEEQKNAGSTTTSNASLSFAMSTCKQLIALGTQIIIGSIVLYSCKVAQTNLLPTCSSASPYTNVPSQVQDILVDINIVKTSKGDFSTKLHFPVDENSTKINQGALGYLRNMIYGPKTNVFNLYIASTLQSVLSLNFNIINTVYNFLNSSIYETIIILFGGYVAFFLFFIMLLINGIYLSILWFYNIYLLFSEKTDNGTSTSWTDGAMWGILSWYWAIFYIFIFIIAFFVVGGLIISLASIILPIFCLFFPITILSRYPDTNKKYGLSETIKNVIKFKMNIILMLVSLYVVLNANSNFGNYATLVAILACGLLYVFSNVYKSYTPKPIDRSSFGLGDYVQATKVCNP